MPYAVPGRADQLSASLVKAWNDTIRSHFDRLAPQHGSRFFAPDPAAVGAPVPAQVTWFGDPAEPAFCLGGVVARELSDWGLDGRHELHNEYCEYRTLERPDATGRLRPKRVEVTTELREYWLAVARRSPTAVRRMAQDALGFLPSWQDLYGVSNPLVLSQAQREIAFATQVGGNGGDRALADAGVPAQPTGPLNTDRALFMTHPINGLDDLLYIVMFGAKPYSRANGAAATPVTREEIFRAAGVEHLACRHADPAAAMGAYGAAFAGRTVAFADPLGVYIRSFARDLFLFEGNPVPDAWVRFSRGQAEMFQRLVFGPPDDHPAFLDDISVATGAVETPLTGGFQLLQQIEVGPLIVVGPTSLVAAGELVSIGASAAPIACLEAEVCTAIGALKARYDAAH
jgi:hypothetical protein